MKIIVSTYIVQFHERVFIGIEWDKFMLLHSYTHLLHVQFHLSLELSSDLSEQCSF